MTIENPNDLIDLVRLSHHHVDEWVHLPVVVNNASVRGVRPPQGVECVIEAGQFIVVEFAVYGVVHSMVQAMAQVIAQPV